MKRKGYISKIREKIGTRKFIHPAARIIIEDEHENILFVERKDNGKLGIPAGGLEENETIEECIYREVKEETGLEIVELELIGISSNPVTETVKYPNGDKIQYFTIEFYSKKWTGKLKVGDVNEIKEAKFRSKNFINELPENEKSIFETLAYYLKEHKVKLH